MISTISSTVGPFTTVQSLAAPINATKLHNRPNSSLFLYGYNESLQEPSLSAFANQLGFDQSESYNPATVAAAAEDDANSTLAHFIRSLEAANSTNPTNTTVDADFPQIPAYIRTTSMVFCIIIMCLGVVGNVMVPIVIMKTKDMRNSTNIFLMNLSIADLMVLLVCTPTVLVEVNTRPETWVLGKEMCLAVPFVELTVAHASVLTILAISFERYYAICEPLKAGYVCTKTRAALICFFAWFIAAVFTSPILAVAEYSQQEYHDGTTVAVCLTQANKFWPTLYFHMTISLFFLIPFLVLLVLYTIIAKNLISTASKVVMNKHVDCYNFRARRQVVMMLGTVVLSFFICLMPFKFLTLWIITVPDESLNQLGVETYYNILYFSRTMLYLNSAINPILYNLMSSKFRDGFLLVCHLKKKNQLKNYRRGCRSRAGTFHTTSSYTTSSSLSRRSNSLKNMIFKKSSFESRSTVRSNDQTPSLDSNKIFDDAKNFSTDEPIANQPNDLSSNIENKNKCVKPKLDRSISMLPNIFTYKPIIRRQSAQCNEKSDTNTSKIQWKKCSRNDDDILEDCAFITAKENADTEKSKIKFNTDPCEKSTLLNKQRSLDSSCGSGNYSLRKNVILKSANSKSFEDKDFRNIPRESYV